MLDYITIFKEFNKKRIKYIVVGGLAVNLYGIPRMTYDIDLIIDFEEKNVKKFLFLLKKLGFKPKLSVELNDFLKKEKRNFWIKTKNMVAFNFVNPDIAISEIDVLINPTFEYLKVCKKINYVSIKKVKVPLISIDDLIKMKSKTNRRQDKTDIKYLKKVRND